jgi:Helicase associated domain
MNLYWDRNILVLVLALLSTSNSLMIFVALGQGKALIPTAPHAEKPSRASWTDRVQQLVAYREETGDTLVPKRYEKNPSLANWVSKQRQEYRKFCSNETPCSLTEDKIRILEGIGFCWDASFKKMSLEDEGWWTCLERLKTYNSAHTRLPVGLSAFLREQRNEYWMLRHGQVSKLDAAKAAVLSAWDSDWWKTSRERQWDLRCQELEDYRTEHGDCCVPISHSNRKLANWVSNVRKQHKLRNSGSHSTLTKEKIDQLNSIGFVWDRWEYEFDVKVERVP